MLELSGVERLFLSVRALRGVDLRVDEGEVVGYVGPNGAGKTTTLNIASTLLRPSRGAVRLLGEDAFADLGRSRAVIGYMPEPAGVYDDMRAAEYLQFFCRAHRVPERDIPRRVAAALADVELSGTEDRPMGTLSKGMRQRIFFARTFLHEPRLLLLDEPFAGLDPSACALVRDKIRVESRRGRAFLIASHDLDELEEVATRFVVVRAGRIAPGPAPSATTWDLRLEGDGDRIAEALEAALPRATIGRLGEDRLEIELPERRLEATLLATLATAGARIALLARRGSSVRRFLEEEPGGDGGVE